MTIPDGMIPDATPTDPHMRIAALALQGWRIERRGNEPTIWRATKNGEEIVIDTAAKDEPDAHD